MSSNLLTGLKIQPDWQLPQGVHATVSTRDGGVSDGGYGSMNLSLTVGDDTAAVQENRMRFTFSLLGEPQCVWLTQLHTANVVAAHEIMRSDTPAEADASWTDMPGIACVVLTADCVPILLAADNGSKVAAIHAGWRGLATGIVQATTKQFVPGEYSAFIGPAISQDNYEIGQDVVTELVTAGVSPRFFRGSKEGHSLADLPGIANFLLKECGARQVQVHRQCTFALPKIFYSARRDGFSTGRIASAIWIEKTDATSGSPARHSYN